MDESDQHERIKKILESFNDISVRQETIQEFFVYLMDNLQFPCDVVTKTEFERYQLDEIENSNDELFGLLGKVRLIAEEEKYTKIPLCDLRAVDNRSQSFQLLNDYSTWFVDFQ